LKSFISTVDLVKINPDLWIAFVTKPMTIARGQELEILIREIERDVRS
jgi:hypothetical protein